MAGDCVTNLRSALDHLVYAFAIRDTGNSVPPDSRKLQFPICDSREAFDGDVRRKRLQGLSVKAQAFVERAQPYHRSHQSLPPVLTVLREFNDLDKHRLLNVAINHITQGQIKFMRPRRKPVAVRWLRNPIKSGAVIAMFDLDPPEPDVDYKFDVTFEVTIAHVPGPTGKNVSPLGNILGLMIEEVTRIVNGAIRA
jgi:hypothetical protein